MATFLQILKRMLTGILLGCLAIVVLALIVFGEHFYVFHHATGDVLSFEDFKWDAAATLLVGVRIIIPALVACTLLIPVILKRNNLASALLIGAVVSALSGLFYANFYNAPFNTLWLRTLHYASSVFLWFLWYTLHTRKRLMREGPRG